MLDSSHEKPAIILAIGSPATMHTPLLRALENHTALFDLSCIGTLNAARQALRGMDPDLILIEAELTDGCSLDMVSELGSDAAPAVVLIANDKTNLLSTNVPAPYLDVLLRDELTPEQLPRTLSRLLRQQVLSRRCAESDQAIKRLQDGNKRFLSNDQTRKTQANSIRPNDLVLRQEPFAIVLGCSDSGWSEPRLCARRRPWFHRACRYCWAGGVPAQPSAVRWCRCRPADKSPPWRIRYHGPSGLHPAQVPGVQPGKH